MLSSYNTKGKELEFPLNGTWLLNETKLATRGKVSPKLGLCRSSSSEPHGSLHPIKSIITGERKNIEEGSLKLKGLSVGKVVLCFSREKTFLSTLH